MIVSFDKFKKKELEFKRVKKSILNLINDFINNDTEFLNNHHVRQPYLGVSDFEFNKIKEDELLIVYRYGTAPFIRNHEIVFFEDEYERLQQFMKDPDMYKKSQKYNI